MADDRGLIQQVKEANDIVEVVGGYIALRPAGPTFKGLCPFHDDSHPSFDVDPRRQRYRCWACNKYGDVITFVQEHEHVDFREALEILARRANISLEKSGGFGQNPGRALMLEVVKWSAEQFQQCLLDDPAAETARRYLGERKLSGETVRRYGLGYAPPFSNWLLKRANQAKVSIDMLETVGLISKQTEGDGYYDRFKDRVIFPIRNSFGKTVGFGGRVLPSSDHPAKYLNTADTPLFKKSELLYGLDAARQEGAKLGYLAVVEGYTDVLMAHQLGVTQVVATMGTALNARHVQQLRRFVPRVVLVFDADAGGNTGVDRALEIFATEDVELSIATLPEGMDPFDLLVAQGPEPFKKALDEAVDALEYKLNQVLSEEESHGIEGRRRAVDTVLGIIARAPDMPGQAAAIKRTLIVTRIAQRLALHQEMVWARLKELRSARRSDEETPRPRGDSRPEEKRAAKADPLERELLEVLLAHPELVPEAATEVASRDIEHPGLRQLLEGLYHLRAVGDIPDLDGLRLAIDNPELVTHALKMQDVGRLSKEDKAEWLRRILERFRERRLRPEKQELQAQLQAPADHESALELLRQLQRS